MLLFLLPIIAASVGYVLTSDSEIIPAERMRDANQAVTFARIQAEMTVFDRFATRLNRESARMVKRKAKELEDLINAGLPDINPLITEVRELTNLADSRRLAANERAVAHEEWQAACQARKLKALSIFSDYQVASESTMFTAEDIALLALPLITSSIRLGKLFSKLPSEDTLDKLIDLLTGNRTAYSAIPLLKRSPLEYVATRASRAAMARLVEEFLEIATTINQTIDPKYLAHLGPDILIAGSIDPVAPVTEYALTE